jgi:Zn-finger nucleic acid-binding protein
MLCPVCHSGTISFYRRIEEFDYFECDRCSSLLIDPKTLDTIDAGTTITRDYDDNYWQSELAAAKNRSTGSSIARVAELYLYARKPINRFVDIGSGPGYLLDSLSEYLPSSSASFYGCELFPPDTRSNHPNYFVGALEDMPGKFDAGVCIEVLEHLTPKMVRKLAASLAQKSEPNSIFLFNTGLPAYVKNEDPGYLDPTFRGHIVSYGIVAIEDIFSPLGFRVTKLDGKNWAFLVEYAPTESFASTEIRIWSACPENIRTLSDPNRGNLLYILGLESARAYK